MFPYEMKRALRIPNSLKNPMKRAFFKRIAEPRLASFRARAEMGGGVSR